MVPARVPPPSSGATKNCRCRRCIHVILIPCPFDYCVLQYRTHLGAAFTGIAYGYLTCPILQMKNASSKNGEDGIAVIRRNVGPCRSLLFFTLFILVLCSLLLVVEPPLSSVALL